MFFVLFRLCFSCILTPQYFDSRLRREVDSNLHNKLNYFSSCFVIIFKCITLKLDYFASFLYLFDKTLLFLRLLLFFYAFLPKTFNKYHFKYLFFKEKNRKKSELLLSVDKKYNIFIENF